MESLSDTHWDVVICGTGLQQSLLALSLSRSEKKILHIDPNEYYGGPDAAFSLQETEAWVDRHAGSSGGLFQSASIAKPEESARLSFSRAYSLALTPQLIHSRSKLLSQLVSSRAYKQVEFLAVGSFFTFKPATDSEQKPTLARVPSTREDIAFDTTLSLKAKRGLMKFLKFVLDYEGETKRGAWETHADSPFNEFLQNEFKMDADLQKYVVTLTLSLDGQMSTKDGLAIIYRHLTSMGFFGPGFAAVYPKWGGISEIAQVACRAGAVGGAVYMLGAGIQTQDTSGDEIQLQLTTGDTVKTKLLVRDDDTIKGSFSVSRLVAVVASPLKTLFESVVEGAPLPAVSVTAFPAGSLRTEADESYGYPIYVAAHSSDTGECPSGQSILYLSTLSTPRSKEVLNKALEYFLQAVNEEQIPHRLFELSYEQGRGSVAIQAEGQVFTLPNISPSLAFDDAALGPIKAAWGVVMGEDAANAEYMIFPDREAAIDDEYDD
ncbi:rab proteins geranylgeranyltransferase component A [Podospora aff. communis PSN243]|uniref:Rab proteins geranylgeranyltransferase n=1 Tax=Podospora aff. communis PSN243 TaxID=3040156 RepID=A0AAV9H1M3_9PEZI|nr:rab proteins geranylgeranyltransferase component A [Podospora aff. communis PSN243]